MKSMRFFISILVLLLAACGGAATPPPPASAPASAASASKPAASASAQPAATTKLTGVFTSLAGNQMPMWVAQEAGIFGKHGIDVSASLLQGSPAMASLLSGEVQLAQGGASEIIGAAAESNELVVLSTLDPYFDFVFVAPNSIKTFADLKGKKLGVAPPGGTVYIATRLVLKRAGLNPDKDVTQVAMGVTQQRAVALQSGAIDGSLLDIIGGKKLVDTGQFHILYDLAAQKVFSAGASTVVKKSWLAANHDLMQRYVDALVEGIARTKQDKTFAVATYKKYTKTDADDVAQATYDYFQPIILAQPLPTAEQFGDTAQIMAEVNPKIAGLDLKALLEASLVQNALDRGVGK